MKFTYEIPEEKTCFCSREERSGTHLKEVPIPCCLKSRQNHEVAIEDRLFHCNTCDKIIEEKIHVFDEEDFKRMAIEKYYRSKNMITPDEITKRRKELGWTSLNCADALGSMERTFTNWERGRALYEENTSDKICDLLWKSSASFYRERPESAFA